MILADKIINERKKLGWSQEELAEKLDVSRQSVSKWESAQSTPDLNRILKMAEIFGVSTDYLLKDEIEDSGSSYISDESPEAERNVRIVSMEEASAFLKASEKTTPRIAFGVSLCIMSAIALIVLGGFAGAGALPEAAAVSIGVSVLLVMVAVAVFIFIMSGKEMDPYNYLEKEAIETAYGVDGMAKDRKNKNSAKNTALIAGGVILCIISSVPIILTGLFLEGKDSEAGIGASMVGLTLFIVSIGVNLIIRGASAIGAVNKLLQEGDYTIKNKKASIIHERYAGIYWCTATAAYLAWSFITNDWHITWIVWPVAGVLWGTITCILDAFIKD